MCLSLTAMAVAAAIGIGSGRARAPAHPPAHAVMTAYRHHGMGGSLVRCTSLRQPGHAAAQTAPRHAARFFAPTSQAVFFAHAGDRCMWRAGAAARG